MNVKEACQILGISQGASEEEVSKAFKKLAATHHPDVNKEPGAEEKFKKFNEAAQFLKKNGTVHTESPFQQHTYSGNPSDIFNQSHFQDFFNQAHFAGPFRRHPQNIIQKQILLTFEESVLGASKEIDFVINTKCSACNGLKKVTDVKDCNLCNGSGRRIYPKTESSEEKENTCNKCHGQGKEKVSCPECNGIGNKQNTVKKTINISPGADHGTSVIMNESNNQFLITIFVQPSVDGLMREGPNVVSHITITLLESLKGTKKIVKTIAGDKTLKIPAMTKNKDIIKAPGLGMPNIGDHLFVITVSYPTEDKINKIAEILEEKNGN